MADEEDAASPGGGGDRERDMAASTTSSRCVVQTVNGSGTGKYIASESFTVCGYQWAIYFYPDGKDPMDNCGFVSVFIALESEATDVRALFRLTLLDQNGEGKHNVHSHFDPSLESGPYTLKCQGSMW